MKKLYALLAGLMLTVAPSLAQDYPTNYSESDFSTHSARYPGSLMVGSPEYGDQTINWASGTKHALYKDATDKEVTVAAGEEVQITVSYTGQWMSAYVYIDLNGDKQFGNDVDEVNHKYLDGSELVSWSFYSFAPESSEDPGWNSLGTQLTGGARSTVNCPRFKAPAEAGTYRVRVKIDWNSIDPAGSVAGHLGGAMNANGGGIIDFMMKVESAFEPVTIQFNRDNGTWTSSNAAKTWAAAWRSNATNPGLTISCPNNNMAYDDNGDPKLYTGTVTKRETQWTISTDEGYVISEYQFNTAMIDGQWTSVTPEGGEEVVTPTTGTAIVKASNINKTSTSFVLKTHADNKGVQLSNFVVTITKAATKQNKQVIFVYDKTADHNVTYRIPSIASISAGAHAGRIVAFTDYRPGGADVGLAEVDIHCRYSDDFGQTWGDEIKIVDGLGGSSPDNRHFSFGDPVSIADRETGKLLMVSCSGRTSYQSASRYNHQGVEVFYSEDGGATWTDPVDVSEQIYSILDNRTGGSVPSLFVGSGGFVQSKFVKKGDYYRVYGGILARVNGSNYVVYTDDFGKTWEVLGGANAVGLTGGDEAKAEELPDGSVLLSSRANGGRIFNIWRWNDASYTTGSWDSQASSNGSNSGIIAGNNSTNGEILIVPAKRRSDNESVYLAMQSVPFGSGRANVGIFWKELNSKDDFATTSLFAANWTKGIQVSFKGSAYSAMVLQEDHNIGFLVEEETYGFGYSQVYHNLSYEMITDSLYTFMSDTDDDFDLGKFVTKRGSITLRLFWNGELKSSLVAYGYIGERVSAAGLPAFVVAELPVLTDENDGTTMDLDVTWDAAAPIQIGESAEDLTYYYLSIKDGNYVVKNGNEGMSVQGVAYTPADKNAMWAFEGNPFDGLIMRNLDGGKLVSADPRGDGNTGGSTLPYVLDEDAPETASVENGVSDLWEVKESTYYGGAGFYIYNKDWNVALNYRAPYLAYWTGGADAGSTFRVVAVPAEDLAVVGVAKVESDIEKSAVYNLAGQRVAVPAKGLYIIGGKKTVVNKR